MVAGMFCVMFSLIAGVGEWEFLSGDDLRDFVPSAPPVDACCPLGVSCAVSWWSLWFPA
jgi:hypothetical protein